jgi:hypothetical protein
MRTNKQRRCISPSQFDRISRILTEQWEEVMSTVQKRSNSRSQERHILLQEAIQYYDQHRNAA